MNFFGGCLLVLMVSVFIWDAFGCQQEWLHYGEGEEPIEYGLYVSLKDCEIAMKEAKPPSGCMRVDGPFRAVGIVWNIIFR